MMASLHRGLSATSQRFNGNSKNYEEKHMQQNEKEHHNEH
jgi:hypothetical protein